MTFDERKQFIIAYLEDNGSIESSYIMSELRISDMTVRRDLDKLEEKEILVRTHGGARTVQPQKREVEYKRRILDGKTKKEAIGKYAARFTENGDTILLDGSTTTQYMLPYIIHKQITVITNSIYVANGLMESTKVEVILIGGKLRKSAGSLNGLMAKECLERYNIDKMFFSSKALDLQHGITDVTAKEGEMKRAMRAVARESYFLVHSEKLNCYTFYNVAKPSEIDHIITDDTENQESKELLLQYESLNVQVHRCKVV